LLFFRNLKPARDNFLVRWLRDSYLRQLTLCLRYRWVTLGLFGLIIAATLVIAVPRLGNEFMPELEEGNLWIRGTFPVNVSLEDVSAHISGTHGGASTGRDRDARIAALRRQLEDAMTIIGRYSEVETIVVQMGRPDDGTDPNGFYNAE